jgi:hypothetical protein
VPGNTVDPNADPMLAAIIEWLKKIEIAIEKAAADGCHYFSCHLIDKGSRIVLRFRRADGSGFKRTLRVDPCFERRGKPLTISEVVDLKICLQSLIIQEPQQLSRLPLGPGESPFRPRPGWCLPF